MLNYEQRLKINNEEVLVKKKSIEQIVLLQKFYLIVYKELHENMGQMGPDRVIEL